MFPILPLRVSTVLFVPEQTATLPPEMLPETAAGLTPIITLEVVAAVHGALETTAR